MIVRLCPAAPLIIDVGADHGHVAHTLGAIATERRPHRAGRTDVPWVVADGLAPFRTVPVAIIAGMGARSIAGILTRGPRPEVLVCHAQDDPAWLRSWLATHHWRIDAEALAVEGRGFAEVIRALPGQEPSTGLMLEFGPMLLAGDDPHRAAWLERHLGELATIARATAEPAPERHAACLERIAFLEGQRR